MKAITLWQPWASLIALGVKTIETRSWATSYRGPLAIHAAKRRCSPDAYDQPLYRPGDLGNPATLPLGAVVATCELVDCVPMLGADDASPLAGAWLREFPDEGPVGPQRGGWWLIGPGATNGGQPTRVEDQAPYGDFGRDRWAWLLADIRPVEPAIPTKGHQGLWEWDTERAAIDEGVTA